MFNRSGRSPASRLAVAVTAATALASLPFAAAAQDGSTVEEPLQTIAEIAVGTPELSMLVTALTVASDAGPTDFIAVASDPGADLTVFAPTNDAFVALGDTLDDVVADPSGLLTDILAYHVLGTSEAAADLIAAGEATTLQGQNVMVTVDAAGNVFIDDAQVVIADIQASNGIVHVIDAVLLPDSTPPPPPPLQTIAEIAVGTPELSTLVTALTVATDAGVVDFLGVASDPDADLTVFAPTNDAFAALGDTLTAALADPSGLLTEVLAYHVLGTSEAAADLIAAGTATTLLGQDVTITVDGDSVFINGAQVLIADIEASNGIVHVIDAVLLPSAPESDIVTDGARIQLISDSDRYLDGDRKWWSTNVDTKRHPGSDTEWILEATGNGTWYLLNAKFHGYLDADYGWWHRNNVDLAPKHAHGTEWDIIELDNGKFALRSVAFDRYLDEDRYNVDTSKTIRSDDQWVIELV